MVVATAQRVVHAPAEAVFALATDPDRMNEWQRSVRRVRRLDRGTVGVGSRLTGERLVLGMAMPFVSEVTRWQPPRLCAFEARGRGVVLRGEQRVDALGPEQSRVTARLELHRVPLRPERLRQPLRDRIEQVLGAELQSLAVLAEREAGR